MPVQRYAVVGGGIIGTAVARRLLARAPDAVVTVLEKEDRLAAHQTGRNSGVVHAGLYYEPGSLKATLCRRGVSLLREFCAEKGLPYEEIGKVLVALDGAEEERLGAIAERARANGVPGVRVIDRAELHELEPHVAGIAALHSPTTAIVDYVAVTEQLAEEARKAGATVRTGFEVAGLRSTGGEVVVTSTAGEEVVVDRVVLCSGLQVDRLARLAGDDDAPRIVPFRGEYYALRPDKRALVNGLVYPVPDPRYPFLGVHLTPRVDGEVLVGPNAVLALAREGYRWRDVSPTELAAIVRFPGFRRFAKQHWRTGLAEMRGSLSKRAYTAAARRYVPELTVEDMVPATAGIRAQALESDGSLVDDFRITRRGAVVAVRNAPSPAATSSLAIAEHLVELLLAEGTAP
ncbi:L-2-hydroxyglutarate oxidase [Geodermatophilus obscurus]|jgi:L-2-hydroxyglutarate oxidase LhgO|uniref:FAD dependent oxidoreductase n=1 Tax=Geodermatophilus obscurus (strain ATCC 25078 / DSM 43160 / JCM 3152 / CCUG 61914 / KCC A-0152 / KCTC 9177 / NBRC 13315 / NRRL B-3577 / G-20) TaxID=526225 RepID=D2SD08_GEOOG|nr:L-2-hydroxyglutarate oxidase [Geodermatophilus obscurus]ADB76357.1 FAD dependent oxidoreductase [Geodermatophilus obscurus DSM 43160]